MEALTIKLLELAVVFGAGVMGFLFRHFHKRDKKRENEIEAVDERVDNLENSHLSLKQRMYGLGDDESDLGHVVETNQRLNKLSKEIEETRKQMREEHQETKMLLMSVINWMEQQEDFDFHSPDPGEGLLPDGGPGVDRDDEDEDEYA